MKIIASQGTSNINFMNYDHNKNMGYLNFTQAIENDI